MNTTPKLLAVALGSVVLAACQTTPPANPDIDAARRAYAEASSTPAVARHAAVELNRAENSLRHAEAEWADKRDRERTRHLAYLAQQRTLAARNIGAQGAIEERLQQAGIERERIRAEIATRAARSAQGEASTARSEAEAAHMRAEAARQQAEAAKQQAAQQGDRAAAMQRQLEEMQARSTQRGMVLTLQDVLFDFGKANLKPGAQRTVDRLASVLQQYPERRILIEGFTDNIGSNEANQKLSERRAEAFRQALIHRGLGADRVEVRGQGEAYPVASNNTAAGRTQNRRVEILFSDAEGRFAPR